MNLVLKDVRHSYALTEVLGGVSLALAPGGVVALVGPSGCGKTTLLHLCAGLLDVQEGRLDNAFANPALMFQQPRLLPWQTTADNIALGLRAQGMVRAAARERAHAMGAVLGLDFEALAAYPHQLSGGMQRRAALARALVLQPDLLLIDEPFAALDIGLKAQLHRLLLLHQAEQGTAVLMITHDLMEAVRLADTVLVMAAGLGRIVHRHTPPAPRWRAAMPPSTATPLSCCACRWCAKLLGWMPCRMMREKRVPRLSTQRPSCPCLARALLSRPWSLQPQAPHPTPNHPPRKPPRTGAAHAGSRHA